ncbi:putative small terminase subunit [Burkholderia phage AMP1]|uniref:DNA maturase A n=4 Tax=Ampunavirus BpAMP1 TaxID=2733589 RepID=A0A0A1I5T9_9CAUD|nr:terminase small subunit [Burkholderia phage Bp-AMP1]QEP52868.1 putative small terminase subunit [Burkholderia phage AMP1]CDK30070.1 hypothetical protein [Burkholderia phage Bp-AMP1]CDL65157.1 hypothetical protein [Burkholderia phage Bp-AMP2]CDL65198.1 hypothetical protein [Burkholderia phage Bp-AMP3]
MAKATEAKLSELHGVVADELKRRIEDGEASAADIGAAIKFLKDNHITASIEDNEGLSDLRKKLEEKMAKRGAKVVPLTRRAVPDETDINDVLDSIERSAM